MKSAVWFCQLPDVFRTHFYRRKQSQKRYAFGCCFDGRASLGFLALHDANHGGNDHVCLARGFDGIDGGCARCTDIVDNHYTGAFATEAFDAAPCSMCLLCLADEKAMEQGGSGMGL